jgi:hypothetical protein
MSSCMTSGSSCAWCHISGSAMNKDWFAVLSRRLWAQVIPWARGGRIVHRSIRGSSRLTRAHRDCVIIELTDVKQTRRHAAQFHLRKRFAAVSELGNMISECEPMNCTRINRKAWPKAHKSMRLHYNDRYLALGGAKISTMWLPGNFLALSGCRTLYAYSWPTWLDAYSVNTNWISVKSRGCIKG